MKLSIYKILFLIFFIWILLSIIKQWPDRYAHVIFCDVGQGDAILITYFDKQILVDGGPDKKVLTCLENNMPFWDKSIDFLVITHMDKDHIGGLPAVLSRYSVNLILKNPSLKKTDDFEALKTSISRKRVEGTRVISSYVGQQLILDKMVRAIVISPQVSSNELNNKISEKTETILSDKNSKNENIYGSNIKQKISENNLSIGLFVIIKNVTILLAGDMEKESELAVIKSGMTRPVNIIKVGHHGSKSSSNRQFISIFKPEVAVISSGLNNQYGHPSPRVIDLFHEFGANIYRTDSQGTIEFITNGINYWRQI